MLRFHDGSVEYEGCNEWENRQIVAGIAKSHDASELAGRQVVVVANMKPAKLFDVESHRMVLAADVEGAVLLMPEKEVKEGTKMR